MSTKKQTAKQRFEDALENAQFAFWGAIADAYRPEVTTGDYPPEATIFFENACHDALKIWLHYNYPQTIHETLSVEEFKKQYPDQEEFYETSPLLGKVVSVRILKPYNEEEYSLTLFISEYQNGRFWTMFSNEDIIGTFEQCAEFLIENTSPKLGLINNKTLKQ